LSDPFEGASDHNCGPQAVAPEAASSAGFHSLSFCDDFNSISTIDAAGTGAPGFNWYTKWPVGRGGRGSGQNQTLPDAYSVSHSVLTVTNTGQTEAWALTTRDPITGNGQAWNFGFFEARIRFDPTLGPKAVWFPAFWSLSSFRTQFRDEDVWPELDFFEAYTQGPNGRGGNGDYPGEFLGTIHHWQHNGNGEQLNYSNSNNNQKVDADWSQWHVVGCLWVHGKVTWYLDGKALMSQEYSATAPPNPLPRERAGANTNFTGVFDVLDTQTMQLILGSAPEWPMYVDWVRVWEK
jgi:hypothetical protein